jgi:hypothetical protein
MFFLERHMKLLMGFLHQREKPKGYMAVGYIVYESFYCASKYIKKKYNTPSRVVWDDQWDEGKREGELLKTNRRR